MIDGYDASNDKVLENFEQWAENLAREFQKKNESTPSFIQMLMALKMLAKHFSANKHLYTRQAINALLDKYLGRENNHQLLS